MSVTVDVLGARAMKTGASTNQDRVPLDSRMAPHAILKLSRVLIDKQSDAPRESGDSESTKA